MTAAMKHILCALALLLPAACSQQPTGRTTSATSISGAAALDALLQRMRQRLNLMHEVAGVKWNGNLPIRDADREAILLRQVVERGRAQQVEENFTRAFFVAQIEAATLIQEADFHQWRLQQHLHFADASTLKALRQQIDEINQGLLAVLTPARSFLQTKEGHEQLRRRAVDWFADFSAPVREAALRPLHGQ